MGYRTRPGTQIQDFRPDDDENTIYINSFMGGESLEEIMARINEKWPGASMANIRIDAEYIHTECLGYDLYDPGDWTNFIVIRRLPGA